MDSIIKRYESLKRKVEEARRNLSRAEAQMESLLERLENEFQVNSIEAASKLLTKLEEQEEALGVELRTSLEELERIMERNADL